jgi:hypothetical protein
MNVCSRCHEVKAKGKRDGINFVCSDCLSKEASVRSQMNRREVQEDGRVKYHCGHIVVIPEVLN